MQTIACTATRFVLITLLLASLALITCLMTICSGHDQRLVHNGLGMHIRPDRQPSHLPLERTEGCEIFDQVVYVECQEVDSKCVQMSFTCHTSCVPRV
jgi:hypothetical protein